MSIRRHLAAAIALAALASTGYGVANAQTASDRLPAAGQSVLPQDDHAHWSPVRNSDRLTPAQIEEANGNKAEPRHRSQDDEQRAWPSQRPSGEDNDQRAPAGQQTLPDSDR